MRSNTFVLVAAAVASLSAAELGAAQAAAAPARSGYAPVNGLRLYYETRGSGQPLVLLHGGLGSIGMFGPVLAALAAGRQVIAVDLQGHGRTADIDRPLTYESMGDDVAALVKYLGLGKVDLMGYSLGAGAALQAALRTRKWSGSSSSSPLPSSGTGGTPRYWPGKPRWERPPPSR